MGGVLTEEEREEGRWEGERRKQRGEGGFIVGHEGEGWMPKKGGEGGSRGPRQQGPAQVDELTSREGREHASPNVNGNLPPQVIVH